MKDVLISYRRDDEAHAVDRLFEALRDELAPRQIFLDIDNIPIGQDFERLLDQEVSNCRVLLAVMGPRWLDIRNKDGQRRLDDPKDFVRIEVLSALKRDIPVVPVLLDEMKMPAADQLPEELRPLLKRQAWEISRKRFKADVEGLAQRLKEILGEPLAPGGTRAPSGEQRTPDVAENPFSLNGKDLGLAGRLSLPASPISFLLSLLLLSAGFWAAGYLVAADKIQFLASLEWQVQPLYLASCLLCHRVLATCLTRNYLNGSAHTKLSTAAAQRNTRLLLGPWQIVLGALIATPFSVVDYPLVAEADFSNQSPMLLFGGWSVEWFLMACMLVCVLGYVVLTVRAIDRHGFRESMDLVLLHGHYRPFFNMVVQSSVVVLMFWIAQVMYATWTAAALSDYAAAIILLIAIFISLFPALSIVRNKVSSAVDLELASVRRGANSNADRIAMLRIAHLEQRSRSLGRSELTKVLWITSVPAVTMLWYGYKYYKGLP